MYDTHISGHSLNNIKCVMHDDLMLKNQATRYILPRHWLYEWFSQFIVVELIRFFHGALQLSYDLAFILVYNTVINQPCLAVLLYFESKVLLVSEILSCIW